MNQQKLQERVGLYSLLRALYTYPLNELVLAAVAGLELPAESPLSPWLSQMQERLNGSDWDPAVLETLNVEMTRLLEGPGQTPAPPYASYYLHDGRLMGPSAVAAQRIYLAWQVVPESGSRIPADHIALELGFLAHLARVAAEAESFSDKVAALKGSLDFLLYHLMPWLPRFCARLSEAAADPFFVGLAGFTRAAVEEDLGWLTTVLAQTLDETTPVSVSQDKESAP